MPLRCRGPLAKELVRVASKRHGRQQLECVRAALLSAPSELHGNLSALLATASNQVFKQLKHTGQHYQILKGGGLRGGGTMAWGSLATGSLPARLLLDVLAQLFDTLRAGRLVARKGSEEQVRAARLAGLRSLWKLRTSRASLGGHWVLRGAREALGNLGEPHGGLGSHAERCDALRKRVLGERCGALSSARKRGRGSTEENRHSTTSEKIY